MIDIDKLYARAEELLQCAKEYVQDDPFLDDDVAALWITRAQQIEFEVDGTLRRCAGNARDSGQIKLSWPIFQHEENYFDYDDTVLHEIAHVMVGCRNGHSPTTWGICCSIIGCSGRVYHTLSRFKKQPEMTRAKKASQLKDQLADMEEDPLL